MRPEARLYQDARHRISLFRAPGGSAKLVLCFEPGRDRMDGFQAPACPRFAERLGIDAITVQAARRDWFLTEDGARLGAVLAEAVAGYGSVTVTGFSMGGYGALLYSGIARASRALLVSPQYCIDPAVAPWDPGRHGKFARIGLPMPRPEQRGNRALAGVLLYDPRIAADHAHAAHILAGFPRLRPIALPYAGHPASAVIGATAGIGQLAEMLVEDRLDAVAIRALHRAGRRGDDSYRLNLARAVAQRHAARALPVLRELAWHAAPAIRLEAGLALLTLDERAGTRALQRLLADHHKAPASWLRRIAKALDH